jgi:phage-related protein
MRQVIFYKTQSGKSPVADFLDSLNAKQAKKVTWVLHLIENSKRVPQEYFKKLSGNSGIWEVRVQSGSNIFRLTRLYRQRTLRCTYQRIPKKVSENTEKRNPDC